jgi:hypothetical protein
MTGIGVTCTYLWQEIQVWQEEENRQDHDDTGDDARHLCPATGSSVESRSCVQSARVLPIQELSHL